MTSVGAVLVFHYVVVGKSSSICGWRGEGRGGKIERERERERETDTRFNRIAFVTFQVETNERDAVSSAVTRWLCSCETSRYRRSRFLMCSFVSCICLVCIVVILCVFVILCVYIAVLL